MVVNSLRVVCLAGPSDSGKTSLVEQLVPRLADTRVGTIKSIHHDIEIDTVGTDTYRHRDSGADTVIGITPTLTFEITSAGKTNPPADPNAGWLFDETDSPTHDDEMRALESALTTLGRKEYEVVLVEGFSQAPLPTIVVGDRSVAGPIIGRGSDDIEALIGAIWDLEPLSVPVRAD